MKKIIRVGGYARVSHEEQKKFGYSIDTQIDKIKKYCDLKEYQLVDIFIDEGFTASNMKRPRLLDLLNNLDKVDAIVFTRLDRFSRNVLEANKMLATLQKNGVSMIAIEEEDINTGDADGLFMFQLKVSLAEREIKKTSERIKSVFEYKVKEGQVISGQVPRGYKIGASKRLVKNEEEEAWVSEVFSYYATHQSVRATMKHINNKYNFDRGYQVYNRILRNEVYTGLYMGNSNYTDPYITKEEYDRNQYTINKNIRERKNKNCFLFSGLIRCPACNRIMVGSNNIKKKYNTNYYYYRCQGYYRQRNCSYNLHIRESFIEEYLLENVEDLAKDYIAKVNSVKPIKISNSDKRKKSIKEELNNLNYIFMKKRITQEDYDRLYTDLETELKKLESNTSDVKDTKALVEFLNSGWRNIYDTLPKESKRSIWRNIVKEIDATPDNIKKVEFL